MGQHTVANWLVAYDVCDRKRLARVFRVMKKEGIPIQYSLFSVRASPQRMDALLCLLRQLIDTRKDDVRAYRVPSSPWQATLGMPILPVNVWQDPLQPFLPGFD
jgi:CRISPR-associated protein Cas2